MNWIKDNAGLFGLGIFLISFLIYGLNSQQKIIDVKFEAIDVKFEAMDQRLKTVEEKINKIDSKLDQVIIGFLGAKKATLIKKRAEAVVEISKKSSSRQPSNNK